MPLADFTWSDGLDLALSVFLIAVGLGLAYVFLRLGSTLGRLSRFLRHAEREVLPVFTKAGGTVDRVNSQLDKLDEMTDSAVEAVAAVDRAVRAVSAAVTAPVQKLSGLLAGLSYGASSFRAHHDFDAAVRAAKEVAARREHDLADDLADGEAGGGPPSSPADES